MDDRLEQRRRELAEADESGTDKWKREPHDYVEAYPLRHGCLRCGRIRLSRWHPKER